MWYNYEDPFLLQQATVTLDWFLTLGTSRAGLAVKKSAGRR